MNKTQIHVTLAALLCTAIAAPAQAPKTPADLDRILFLEAQTTIAIKQQIALLKAKDDSSPLALARLANLLQRYGAKDEYRQLLVQLQTKPSPYARWAKARLASIRAEQGGESTMSDHLVETVKALDRSPVQRGAALHELRQLGALALPEILRQLPEFGPVGMGEGLQLVLPHLDQRVLATLRKMLGSAEPIVQTLAASVVPKLRGDERIELGRMALQSQTEPAQMHGVEALLDAGVELDRCLATIERLRHSSSQTVRSHAHGCMSHSSLRDHAKIDTWLEQAIHSKIANERGALIGWLQRRQPNESARRVAMFKSLPEKLATHMIYTELAKPIARQDHDLVFEGLIIEKFARDILSRVPAEVVVRDLPRLNRMLRDASQIDNGPQKSAMEQLLLMVAQRRVRGTEDAVRKLLDSPIANIRTKAFDILAGLEPNWILDNHQRFLNRESARQLFAVVTASARPKDMAWIFAAAQQEHLQPYFRHTGPAFEEYSDASNLQTGLDMINVMRSQQHNPQLYGSRALNKWFGPEHVTPTLRRLHEFDQLHARDLAKLINKHATATDVLALVEALQRMVKKGAESFFIDKNRRRQESAAIALVKTLGPLGGTGSTYLKTLLLHPALGSPAMASIVQARDFDRRATYLQLLQQPEKPSRTWTSAVATVLNDEWTAKDPDTRAKAVELFRDWTGKDSPQVLILLNRLPKDQARALAIALADRIGTDHDIHDRTAQDALIYLGDLREEALIETLAKGLRSKTYTLRKTAIEQLGRTLTRKAAPHLIAALGDDNHQNRTDAEQHLETIFSILLKKQKYLRQFKEVDK